MNNKNNIFNHYMIITYVVILFISINILNFSWFKNVNFDVTDEKRFSVSQQSFEIVDKIPERVDLKLYISEMIFTQMPTIKNYAHRIQDFLQQLEKKSHGRLKVTTTIIQPFSEEEEQAITLGLKPIPFKNGEGLFFGIVAENMIDGEGVIPFLNPDRDSFIEYDIARLIEGVTQLDKVKVAITSSLPLETGSGGTVGVLNGKSNPYHSFKALQARYQLIGLSEDYHELLDSKNRPKIALILHPRPLTKKANENLKRYLATGGRALIAVDPLSEALPLPIGSLQKNAELYSDAPEIFADLGLVYQNQLIVLDMNHARKIINPQTSLQEEYLAWLKFTHQDFNMQSPTMTSIDELSFSTVGLLQRHSDFKGDMNYTPLIFSLQKADFIKRSNMIKLNSTAELSKNYKEKIPYSVAMLVTGKISSFSNSQETAVIVIADSDFLDDRLWLKNVDTNGDIVPFADNLNLLLNYTDYLAGDDALIALRGRKVLYRPLTYLENIKKSAEKKFIEQEQHIQNRIQELRETIIAMNKDYSIASGQVLPDKIRSEIEKFSQELVILRKKLREVRRNMNIDIRDSEHYIKLVNVIVVPLCFGIIALLILVLRKSKALKKQQGG